MENVIKRYHNNQIDTAQVIEELSAIAREMKLEDKKSHDLGLSPEEYAFYMILSQNQSTEFLEDYKMAKFDYFNFSDGSWDTEFVAHAKKYSKNETLEL